MFRAVSPSEAKRSAMPRPVYTQRAGHVGAANLHDVDHQEGVKRWGQSTLPTMVDHDSPAFASGFHRHKCGRPQGKSTGNHSRSPPLAPYRSNLAAYPSASRHGATRVAKPTQASFHNSDWTESPCASAICVTLKRLYTGHSFRTTLWHASMR